MDCGERKQAVFQYVLDKLVSGELPAGSPLPTETELSEMFGLSRYHVHRALEEFFRRNVLVCRRKGGLIVSRKLFACERRQLSDSCSDTILLVNHYPPQFKWSVVHINEVFFAALKKGLSSAGLKLVCEEIPRGSTWESVPRIVRRYVEKHRPRAVIVVAGGHIFRHLLEFYYLLHDRVFVYTRSGFLEGAPLLSTIGIANCLDGVAAAETAFAGGAEKLLFCYRSDSPYVMKWQMERRYGVQLCLRRHSSGQTYVDDYLMSGDFPFTAPRKTTALIAHNDELAAELIDAGRRNGLEPGRDYKIIGFGDDPRFREYELTTLRPDLPRIGSGLAAAVVRSCTVPGRPPVISQLVPSIPVRRKTS